MAADIRIAAGHDEGRFDEEELLAGWMHSVGQGVAGYVTPKVAVGAIVGNERGELLLIQRGDSGRLALPDGLGRCGLLGVEVVVKEVEEETGIIVEPSAWSRCWTACSWGAGAPLLLAGVSLPAVGGALPAPSRDARRGMVCEVRHARPLAGGGRWVEFGFRGHKGERDRGGFRLASLEHLAELSLDDVAGQESRPGWASKVMVRARIMATKQVVLTEESLAAHLEQLGQDAALVRLLEEAVERLMVDVVSLSRLTTPRARLPGARRKAHHRAVTRDGSADRRSCVRSALGRRAGSVVLHGGGHTRARDASPGPQRVRAA